MRRVVLPKPNGEVPVDLVVQKLYRNRVRGMRIASAHRPWFNFEGSQVPNAPYKLEEISVSQVVYGGFSEAGRVDYFSLAAPAGFFADSQIVVPKGAACADFRPAMVIAGPGLISTGSFPVGLKLPTIWQSSGDIGWTVIAGDEWGPFFEPFTRTTYATSPRFQEPLQKGDYLIAIVELEGDAGTYGLALGGSERFGGDPLFISKNGSIDGCQPPSVSPSPASIQ